MSRLSMLRLSMLRLSKLRLAIARAGSLPSAAVPALSPSRLRSLLLSSALRCELAVVLFSPACFFRSAALPVVASSNGVWVVSVSCVATLLSGNLRSDSRVPCVFSVVAEAAVDVVGDDFADDAGDNFSDSFGGSADESSAARC